MLKSHARSRLKDRLRAVSEEKHGSGMHWTDGFMGFDNEAVLLMFPVMILCSPLASVVALAPAAMLFLSGNFWVVLIAIIPALAIGATLAVVIVFTMQRSPTSWIVYEWLSIVLGFPVGFGLGYLIAALLDAGTLSVIPGVLVGSIVGVLQFKFRKKTIAKLQQVRLELLNDLTSGGAAAPSGKDGKNG